MAMANDTPRRMTREQAEELDQELLDRHPHLGRPTVQPVYSAIAADHWKSLLREKGSYEAADADLLARRHEHFDAIEKRTMQTIRSAARIKPGNGESESSFVKQIQRDQYERNLYPRPDWMSNDEARAIEQDRRARSRMPVMRVSG